MSEIVKNRVGLFGGAFDPIHYGHLGLAREAREKFGLERVVFITANISPHKRQGTAASAACRLEMARLATRGEPSFEVSDIEIKRSGVSYTIDTLSALRKDFPCEEFYMMLGRDSFHDLDSWKDYRRLMESCHILVATRPGFSGEQPEQTLKRLFQGTAPYQPWESGEYLAAFQRRDNGRRLIFFQPTPKDISSRAIRGRCCRKASIKNMLPPHVERYIIEKKLYLVEFSSIRRTKESLGRTSTSHR